MPTYSTLTLCGNVPLDPRYEHTLTFTSKAAQLAWFNGMRKYEPFTDFTYLRKDSAIRVSYGVEELEEKGINYLVTVNDEKARFYFITSKEYKGSNCTELHVELDVLQTYQFDWTIPPCFVEREHVNNDAIGANTIPEGLEVGEYYIDAWDQVDMGSYALVVQSSLTLQNPIGEHATGGIINGVYNGLRLYTRSADALGALVINAVIKSLDTQGKSDAISSIWMYPKKMMTTEEDWAEEGNETMLRVVSINPFYHYTGDGLNTETLDGYSPRNKKLLCYLFYHSNCR